MKKAESAKLYDSKLIKEYVHPDFSFFVNFSYYVGHSNATHQN